MLDAASVLLVAGGVVAPTGEAGAEQRSAGVLGLVDSARLAGPVVVEGVLRGNAGDPAPPGEIVRLEAWPAPAVLARAADGAVIDVVPVGYALTDGQGKFRLRYADAGTADRYAGDDGRVNVEVTAGSIGATSSYSLIVDSPSLSSRSTLKPVGVQHVGVVGKQPFVTLPALSGASRRADITAGRVGCVTRSVSSFGDKWVTVGAGYSSIDVKMDFSYTSGASSELGVGVSASGKAGTFRQSGTSSISSNSTIDFPTVAGATGRFWKTQFEYKKYRKSCYVPNAPKPKVTYYAKAASYSGGSKSSTPQRPPTANYCNQFEKGTTFTRASSSAWTATTGVESGSAIGVNLSSRTGYSSEAKIKFVFLKTHRLCGTDAKPGGSPKRLVAKH